MLLPARNYKTKMYVKNRETCHVAWGGASREGELGGKSFKKKVREWPDVRGSGSLHWQ